MGRVARTRRRPHRTATADDRLHEKIFRRTPTATCTIFAGLCYGTQGSDPKNLGKQYVLFIPFLYTRPYLIRSYADEFRVALLSYADSRRLYSSSKSRWTDFNEALGQLMENCVRQGTGGAYLVPRKLPSISQKKKTDPRERTLTVSSVSGPNPVNSRRLRLRCRILL